MFSTLSKDVLKNRFISKYFLLVALKSPVKFSQCFPSVEFRTKFEVVQQKQYVSHCESLEIRLLYRKMNGI